MTLKQSIVVRNEFTHNNVNTPGKGSRGGTPGEYVLRYMSRIEATETITPVPARPDTSVFDYTTRYMLREDATERLKLDNYEQTSIFELTDEFDDIDMLSGRSFGSRGITLSDDTVRESSEVIQDAFDEGHSVQKIILSFTEEYLKDNKVLHPDYKHKGRGSYRGHLDQLKLRQAVINGVDKMTAIGDYANPEWVGVIQVDTNHVHAHLALVDTEFSPTRMMDDGRDKGKLTQREMMTMRRGIQYELNEMKAIKNYHRQVSLERQSVVGYVRDYAYDHIGKNSRLQIIMASLPEEQNRWRYGSNREDMRYPNELARTFVQDIFDEYPDDSGYNRAIHSIQEYIDERTQTEGIDQTEQDRLRKNGEHLIYERSINSLYDTLKVYDKSKLDIRTPMLDIQSSSDDELLGQLSDGFDQVDFELRVRGYSNRRDHHLKESKQFKELVDSFDEVHDAGNVAMDAFILRQFYEEELLWHMGLTDKYRSFFQLNGRHDRQMRDKHYPTYERLVQDYRMLEGQDELLDRVDDGSIYEILPNISSKSDVFKNNQIVDDILEKEYNVQQGSRAFSAIYRDGFEDELNDLKEEYVDELKDYTFDCFMDGVATQKEWSRLQENHRGVDLEDYEEQLESSWISFKEPIEPQVRSVGITDEHFDSVKAYDIHHLGIDYYSKMDREVSDDNRINFALVMQWREYYVNEAERYLRATNQRGQLQLIEPIRSDVEDMRKTVDYMAESDMIPTVEQIDVGGDRSRNTNTIRVDTSVNVMSSVDESLIIHDEDLERLDELDVVHDTQDIDDIELD